MISRAFISLHPDGKLQGAIRNLIEHLQLLNLPVHWVSNVDVHLTLRFLGTIQEGHVASIVNFIRESAANTQPFEVVFDAIEVFPKHSPRIVSLRIAPHNNLISLQSLMSEKLDAARIGEPATREFYPHVTLGRITPPWRNMKHPFPSFEPMTWTVSTVSLYSSILTSTFPRHILLSSVSL